MKNQKTLSSQYSEPMTQIMSALWFVRIFSKPFLKCFLWWPGVPESGKWSTFLFSLHEMGLLVD